MKKIIICFYMLNSGDIKIAEFYKDLLKCFLHTASSLTTSIEIYVSVHYKYC